jgi:cytosine/adenosine deaminase-related metal-dependent hydrolase
MGRKFKLTTKRLVQLATIDGARDLGFDRLTGSLTPGKRADLILVRTGGPNIATMGDPYDALVQLAQPSDVDLTMVDGRVLYRQGRFTALDHEQVAHDAAQSLAALKAQAKWS